MSFASAQHLGEVLQQSYGITPTAVVPRPVGADANASVYRVDARHGQWWLMPYLPGRPSGVGQPALDARHAGYR